MTEVLSVPLLQLLLLRNTKVLGDVSKKKQTTNLSKISTGGLVKLQLEEILVTKV